MKVCVNGMNITASVEISEIVEKGNIIDVKRWIKQTREALPYYVKIMVSEIEKDIQIKFIDIYTIRITYYECFKGPVVGVWGKGVGKMSGSIMIYEAFRSEAGITSYNRFEQI